MNSHLPFLLISLTLLTACSPATVSTPTITEATQPVPTPVPSDEQNIVLYRGNTQRTGVYDGPAIRQLPEIEWQSKISTLWLMPPLITENILYTGGGDGSLYALDIQSGEKIWSANGFGQMESTGAIAGDAIVAGGYSKLVQALNRYDGQVLWTFSSSYVVQASPLIVEEHVFIATDHATYALDLQTGELIWETATGEEDAFMGAPAFENDVIYTTGGKLLLALNSENGEELWHVEHDSPFTALAVANGFVYVGNNDRVFRAYDQETGEERWRFEAGGPFWSAPAIAGNALYVGNDDQIYALDAGTGEMLWSYQAGGRAVSEPVIVEDVVYVSDSSHEFPLGPRHLYALDASTGTELWVFETRSTFLPAPGVGEHGIYLTIRGDVLALK